MSQIKISELPLGIAENNAVVPATNAAGNQTSKIKLSDIANLPHNHDDRYYTEAETNALLNGKAPLDSPTFTGTVNGITKSMVGLGNVDNTSDANKPVSTAQAAADSAVQSAAASDATAKANTAQTYAVQRANHTGTQAISTIDGLQAVLDNKQPSGSYATLVNGTVPAAQLPTPGSTDSVAEGSVNKYYTDQRASAAAPVQSVAGKTGAVTLTSSDITDLKSPVNASVPWTANHTLADGTSYLAGDVVYSNGNIYRAKFDNESRPTSDTVYWENLGPGHRINIDGRDVPNIPYPVTSVNGLTGNVTIDSANTGDIIFNNSTISTSAEDSNVLINCGQNTNTLGPPVAGGANDRVRLWDFKGGGTNFNYAIGAEGNHVWFAMDVNNGTGGFKFYSRDNEIFKISDDSKLMFPNGTTVAEGTFDNGTGGNGGISLNCVVGYELNWQGGRLKSTYNNGESTAPIFVDSPMSAPPVVLESVSYSNTINTDAKSGDMFDITLTENSTLANPTNPVNGKTIRWRITQDGTGNRTVTLGSKFNIPSSATSPLPWSTAPNKMDVLAATYHAGRDKWDVVAFVPGY